MFRFATLKLEFKNIAPDGARHQKHTFYVNIVVLI